MARYTCGRCSEPVYGLGEFEEHVEQEHDYEHLAAAVKDCESIDEPGVIELQGKKVVKCSNCQTLYDAIGAQCPDCGCDDVMRDARNELLRQEGGR